MRIGIIGAGISGLSAALSLSKSGHHVEVFERAPSVGGLISTFDFDGIRIERFYHFLCGGDDGYFGLCKELGLDDRIRFVKPKTGFYYEGRHYPFTTPLDLLRFTPIPFVQRLRFGTFALGARWREEWVHLDELRAKPWLIDRIGLRAYEVVWEPLLSLKFGGVHERISAAWVWHRLHRVARSKGSMGYLEGGTALLIDTLLERIRAQGGVIHTGHAAERLLCESGRVRGVSFSNGESYECDQVVSTLPMPVLAGLVPPEWKAYADELRGVDYIGVVCAVFKLTRPLTRNFWLNVNDSRIPFNGIIEYTNLNPLDRKSHIAYVPYYIATDHPLYRMSDAEIIEQSWSALDLLAPDLTDAHRLGVEVFRAAYAQAVCPVNFLDVRPDATAPIPGLHLLDSIFLYPEDRTQSGLILRARECARKIAGGS